MTDLKCKPPGWDFWSPEAFEREQKIIVLSCYDFLAATDNMKCGEGEDLNQAIERYAKLGDKGKQGLKKYLVNV